MELNGKKVMITGGTRGLGKAMADEAITQGAEVWVLGRNESNLSKVTATSDKMKPICLDISQPGAAEAAFDIVIPDVLILCAGATPRIAPVQDQSWEDFSVNWMTDVRASHSFGSAALNRPMAKGSKVVTISSGAAIGGSVASGGYAGAKRMQWFLSDYFQQESNALDLDLRFLTILPKQQFGGTELGHAASSGYADRLGIPQADFLARFKDALSPDGFAELALKVLTNREFEAGRSFGIDGAGIEQIN